MAGMGTILPDSTAAESHQAAYGHNRPAMNALKRPFERRLGSISCRMGDYGLLLLLKLEY